MRKSELGNWISDQWTVDDVMEHFGDWIDWMTAEELMVEVQNRERNNSYLRKMDALRDLLRYEYGAEGIPFKARYWKSKGDINNG